MIHLSPELALVEMTDGKHRLLRLRHLDQGRVLLVEQNLHPLLRIGNIRGAVKIWTRGGSDPRQTSDETDLNISVDPKEDEKVVTLCLSLAHVGHKEDAAGPSCCAPRKAQAGLRAEKNQSCISPGITNKCNTYTNT